MEYRILGKTGLKVSVVGFGGIPIQRVSAGGECELRCPYNLPIRRMLSEAAARLV